MPLQCVCRFELAVWNKGLILLRFGNQGVCVPITS